jgi:hypothetical protein
MRQGGAHKSILFSLRWGIDQTDNLLVVFKKSVSYSENSLAKPLISNHIHLALLGANDSADAEENICVTRCLLSGYKRSCQLSTSQKIGTKAISRIQLYFWWQENVGIPHTQCHKCSMRPLLQRKKSSVQVISCLFSMMVALTSSLRFSHQVPRLN